MTIHRFDFNGLPGDFSYKKMQFPLSDPINDKDYTVTCEHPAFISAFGKTKVKGYSIGHIIEQGKQKNGPFFAAMQETYHNNYGRNQSAK